MPTVYEPGDIVTLERCEVHYVYELIDDFGVVFYVGMAKDPEHRFREHARSRSAKQARADAPGVARAARIASCLTPRMRIVSRHDRREDAARAEQTRMRSLPALLNLVDYWQEQPVQYPPSKDNCPFSDGPIY